MSGDRGDAGKTESAFAAVFSACLDKHNRSRSDLARDLGTSRSYVSQLAVGSKNVSAKTVDAIAASLDASPQERAELHRAAAKDAGFRIDLPDDF